MDVVAVKVMEVNDVKSLLFHVSQQPACGATRKICLHAIDTTKERMKLVIERIANLIAVFRFADFGIWAGDMALHTLSDAQMLYITNDDSCASLAIDCIYL